MAYTTKSAMSRHSIDAARGDEPLPARHVRLRVSGSEIKINFEITEFTAICPFSDFPDFATIRIEYVPNERYRTEEPEALHQLFPQRKIFHEHVINIIWKTSSPPATLCASTSKATSTSAATSRPS